VNSHSPEDFVQEPPRLPDPYRTDIRLRELLRREMPAELQAQSDAELVEIARLVTDEFEDLQRVDRLNEPRLVQWDAWGTRIDRIDLTALWHRAEQASARHGLVATAYEKRFGPYARLQQFALVYLFNPTSDLYTCPLAMTDGAARTLIDSGNQSLIDRIVPHLITRNPEHFWTSGQWMTELTGGSDVGRSLTRAEPQADGTWRLWGRKWFTSAATSQVALTLARPVGNPEGGKGLALFLVETRDAEGRPRGFRVERLKDKLGTRKLPTAELTLDGAPATQVQGTTDGVRNIAPMLTITRTWNSICAVSYMRRGLLLATDYAERRVAFGTRLIDKPLHADTLQTLEAETAAAFHLSFFLAQLAGRGESKAAEPAERPLLRLVAAIVKLTTGRQAVAVLDEVMECFGGAGYVEDTGIAGLVRDAHVLPIWEGTTNVLALETLDAATRGESLEQLIAHAEKLVSAVRDPALQEPARVSTSALREARTWLHRHANSQEQLEAGARRFALTLGRSLALALLVDHAQWALEHGNPASGTTARRFAALGTNLLMHAPED
jgi:alkylation response protein AidB-like acyl-CoA dehydrogenase